MYAWETAANMVLTKAATTATPPSSSTSSTISTSGTRHGQSTAATPAAPTGAQRDGHRRRHRPRQSNAAGDDHGNGTSHARTGSVEGSRTVPGSPYPPGTETQTREDDGGGWNGKSGGDLGQGGFESTAAGSKTFSFTDGERETSRGTTDESPSTSAALPAPPVAAAAGVVIRVLISGAHASFLHMRVFPSTTAGQVCRKIGEKLRQTPAEQSDHLLVAIYARPAEPDLPPSPDTAAKGDEVNGVRTNGGVIAGLLGSAGTAEGAAANESGASAEREAGGEGLQGRRRRREEDSRLSSVRHVLHTFRPEERLGELRLGLAQPPPPLPSQRRQGTDVTGGETSTSADEVGGIGGDGDGDADGRGSPNSHSSSSSSSSSISDSARRVTATAAADSVFPNGGGTTSGAEAYPRAEGGAKGHNGGRLLGGEGGGSTRSGSFGEGRGVNGEGREDQPSGGSGGGGGAAVQALNWRSRWIYREKTAPALGSDELQVEVRFVSANRVGVGVPSSRGGRSVAATAFVPDISVEVAEALR